MLARLDISIDVRASIYRRARQYKYIWARADIMMTGRAHIIIGAPIYMGARQ